jgi:hypothetical protein
VAVDQVDESVRACPLCREEIRSDAVRCKHCGGWIGTQSAGHGGVCPFCREQIHPEAIRCRHCRTDLVRRRRGDHGEGAAPGRCGCGGRRTRRRIPSWTDGYGFDRGADAARGITTGPTHPGSPCPAWVDDNGWFGILVDWDDESCTYEEY